MTRIPAPFYLVVVFWGTEHRNYFLRFLIPSLLSPGNLHSLPRTTRHRFLIVTTTQDWTALQSHPAYQELACLIEPVFLELPAPDDGANKYLVMSDGHKLATTKVFTDRAYGVFVTPDLVLSDGSIATLQRLALAGKKVVLCAAMRFTTEGCVPEVEAFRETSPAGPLGLPPRSLAAIALRNMHDETLRYDWDAPFFADSPYSCFWRVPGEEGIVLHSFSWAPLLVSYGDLIEHSTDTFNHWTMDGDYIFRNFPEERDIHVVCDSDEIMLVSFTGADDRPGFLAPDALTPRWYNVWPLISHFWKVDRLRRVRMSPGMDPLKRRIFRLAVRIHASKANSATWQKTESRAAKIIAHASAPATLFEKILGQLIQYVRDGRVWPFNLLYTACAIVPYAKAANIEFANQSGVDSYRAWLIGPSLTSGRWYWEISSPSLGRGHGTVADTVTVGVMSKEHSIVKELGSGKTGWGWRGNGQAVHAGRTVPHGRSVGNDGAVLMIALDMDARKIWFGQDGLWFGSGDPATGANPAFGQLSSPVFPAISSRHGGFGTAILRTRVTRDAWTYSPPYGFQPLPDTQPPCSQTHESASLSNMDSYVRGRG